MFCLLEWGYCSLQTCLFPPSNTLHCPFPCVSHCWWLIVIAHAVCTCMCVVLSYCGQPGDCVQSKYICILYVSYSKCTENGFIVEDSATLWNGRKRVDLQLFYQNSWNITCYCTQLLLVSTFKSLSLPAAGLFTVTAWIWNGAIYTTDHK